LGVPDPDEHRARQAWLILWALRAMPFNVFAEIASYVDFESKLGRNPAGFVSSITRYDQKIIISWCFSQRR
jgi:hypothetical protein